ncbi:MAG: AIR synthase family protein [Chloroflexi bacterium]|nr:AIR synthase family protein [Chloroflexota bacterium]
MPDSTRLPAGKLPPDLLASLLGRLPKASKRLLTGPGVGEDAAVLSFGATSLVAKADPVTFATDLIGWYAVNVNANDIAATGATPKWFMPTVLLPENVSTETVEEIFTQLQEATQAIGVELIGGHTEITVGLPRPIISGAMLGEAAASRTISTGGARTGDEIILTKGIAIEGTSLLAREFGNLAVERGVPATQIEIAAEFLFNPGISVLKDARVAMAAGTVTAMHDPTEGGLASALAELSAASGNGMTVDYDAVTVLPECIALCDALGVDPLGLIASGALLITCAPGTSAAIIDALDAEGISANVIGKMTSRGDPAVMTRSGQPAKPLPVFARDEIARLFETT